MDLPSLERTVTSLEQSLDSWELWLAAATLLVVVGLILEYFYQVRDLIKERPIKWRASQEIIGAILVTIGVAGELGIQFKAAHLETRVRSANHAIEVSLNNKASEAQQQADAATATSLGAAARIADANKAASEANARAAEATAMTEAEKLERLRLEAQVAPRSLSLDQQRLIAAACDKFRGRNVLVQSYGLDGEGAALGAQIIAALRAAHVTVLDSRASSIVTGGFEVGVHVRGPASEQEFVSSLGNALASIGNLQVSLNDAVARVGSTMFGGGMGGGGQAFPAGTVFVSIMVGIKPVPVLPVSK